MFVVKNIHEFTTNSDVHTINTRHKSDLHPPSIKLTKYQKEFITQGSKFSITDLKVLRNYPGM